MQSRTKKQTGEGYNQAKAQAWERAFRKAFRQYGHRSQAERVAWAAMGRPLERKTVVRRSPRKPPGR